MIKVLIYDIFLITYDFKVFRFFFHIVLFAVWLCSIRAKKMHYWVLLLLNVLQTLKSLHRDITHWVIDPI